MYTKYMIKMDLEEILHIFLIEDSLLEILAIIILYLHCFDKVIFQQHFVENLLMSYIEPLRKFGLFAVTSRTILDSGLDH
jgi:hypothetical protein